MADLYLSDSEDEATHTFEDNDIVSISVEQYKQKVADHLTKIESLTLQLAISKADHTSVQESNQEQVDLFTRERASHAEEMAKRQQRIDFLMDRMISK